MTPESDQSEIIKNTFSFNVYEGQMLLENMSFLSVETAEIARDAFGANKKMSAERMASRLLNEGSVIMARSGEQAIGFQSQMILEAKGKRLLYYSIAIRRNSQGSGLGGKLFKFSLDHYHPDAVAARSQNPAAIYSARKQLLLSGVKYLYPFDRSFSDDQEARELLVELVSKLGKQGSVDLETGLQRGAYSEGKLGDYEINLAHPGTREIEAKLEEIGLNREQGDALFYLAFLPAKSLNII